MFRLVSVALLGASIIGGGSAYAFDADQAAHPAPRVADVLGFHARSKDANRFSVDGSPSPALLAAITRWLAANFDLPASHDYPRVELAPAHEITLRRYGAFTGGARSAGEAAPGNVREVVAVYDDRHGIIYLPDTWSGATPEDLSILVHEMVHHLQKLAGLTYLCPGAREQLAYAAQETWLGLFGLDLAGAFDIDPFTRLATTTCPP